MRITPINEFNLLTNEEKTDLICFWVEKSSCECSQEYFEKIIDELFIELN